MRMFFDDDDSRDTDVCAAVRYLRRHTDDYDLVHDNQSLSYGMLQRAHV